jgi:ABC-2 type transport system permease protein
VRRAKLFAVMRREYVESVRKKSFLFGLVATPLLFGVMIVIPMVSQRMLADQPITIGVLDRSGFGERLAAAAAKPHAEGPPIARAPTLLVVPPSTKESELDRRVTTGELTGWILLGEDFAQTGRFSYRAESVTNFAVLKDLEASAGRVLAESKAAAAGLEPSQVAALLRPAEIHTVRIGRNGEEHETEFDAIYLRAVALVMVMFFALMPTGHILLRSVVEEKANRVIEVLVSSMTPLELMVGKILGLGTVGLTLLATWSVASMVLSAYFGRPLPISSAEMGLFLMYFVPGYFLFAALLGTIGSLVSSEREAQPFLTPLSIILVFPVIMGTAIAQNPDHWVARALSFFPLLTPSMMLFRFAIKEPPLWEIAATWGFLVASTVVMFWAAARVFRVGILLTGKRPSLPEVARWAWSK